MQAKIASYVYKRPWALIRDTTVLLELPILLKNHLLTRIFTLVYRGRYHIIITGTFHMVQKFADWLGAIKYNC